MFQTAYTNACIWLLFMTRYSITVYEANRLHLKSKSSFTPYSSTPHGCQKTSELTCWRWCLSCFLWRQKFEDRIVVSKDQPESDAKTMMALFQRCLAVLGSILTEINPQKWLKRNTLHIQSGTQIMLRMELINKLIPTEIAVNTLLS